jgi:hypothetical protein
MAKENDTVHGSCQRISTYAAQNGPRLPDGQNKQIWGSEKREMAVAGQVGNN